mgnify:CR=1 FL=1
MATEGQRLEPEKIGGRREATGNNRGNVWIKENTQTLSSLGEIEDSSSNNKRLEIHAHLKRELHAVVKSAHQKSRLRG